MEKLFGRTYTRNQLLTAGLIASGSLLALAFYKKYFTGSVCRITQDLTGKIIVITEADTEIGKETIRELARLNATIIVGSKNPQITLPAIEEIKTETKNPNIEFIQLDFSDFDSVKKFAETFKAKYNRLDILINNAGVMSILKRTKHGYEAQFGTSHFKHLYLIKLLLDVIKTSAPSRIVNVSSRAQLEVNSSNLTPLCVYNQSKLANIMFSRELQGRMDEENVDVKVVSVHPGLVRSELSRYLGENVVYKILAVILSPVLYFVSKNANQGVQTILYCALEEQHKLRGGGHYAECKESVISDLDLDDASFLKISKLNEKLAEDRI